MQWCRFKMPRQSLEILDLGGADRLNGPPQREKFFTNKQLVLLNGFLLALGDT